MVREPNLLPNLVMAVLTNAIDTEGNLPEELTARIKATIQLKGHDPIELARHPERPPLHRARWGRRRCSARSPRSSTSWSATRWRRSGSSRSTATSRSRPGRTVATIESVRLASDRLEPGETLRAFVTLKPFKGERQTVEVDPAAARRPARRDATRRPSAT